MAYTTFVAGQYKIRQRGNKYYVYLVEKGQDSKVKEHYVGPLDKIVEFYVKYGGLRVSPTMRGVGLEPTQAYTSGASVRPL
ncbi:integrase [Sulfolobus acidocaldarius N8]|uniref:Integrase n=2 Tax=Sulfolobus acidocaldarius TaxID=2285 RepID=M1IXN0_9CREN|nr:integrase [Sulfolobus acidocaldarius N8]AGE73212.1 integrase [Sulfolobus acidocaldarius Ron12/I]